MISLKRTNFLMLSLLAIIIISAFYYFYSTTKEDYQKSLSTNIRGDVVEVGYFVVHALSHHHTKEVMDILDRGISTHPEYASLAVITESERFGSKGANAAAGEKKSIPLEMLDGERLFDDRLFSRSFTYERNGQPKSFELLVELDNGYLKQNETRLVLRTVLIILFFVALLLLTLFGLYLTNILPLIRLTAYVRGEEKAYACRFNEFSLLQKSFSQKFDEVNELNRKLEERVAERTEKLKETNRVYEQIQHLAHLGSWEWNIKEDILFWSDEIYRIFGLQPREFSATFDAFMGKVHQADRQRLQDAVDAALHDGKEYSVRHRIVLADGSEKIVHERGRVELDEEGNPARMVGSIQDITRSQRQRAELSLQAAMLNLVPDSIFVHGEDEPFIYVNEAAYKSRGYTKSELLAMGIDELDAPADPQERKARMQQIKKDIETTGSAFFEVEQRKKDGSTIPVEIRTQWIDLEDKRYFISIVRDITARKKMLNELVISEKKYKGLVENSLVGVFRTDTTGRVLYANDAVARIMEYESVGEMTESSDIIVHYRDPEERNVLLRELEEKGVINGFEVDVITKKGNPKTVMLSARLVDDYLYGMVMDITAQKKAREEITMLSRAVEEIDDVVVMTDSKGIITYVNRAFEKHTGYTKQEALGKTSRLLKSGEHTQEFYKKMWAKILEGKVYKGLVINRKKDGELYHEAKTISPIRNEEGEIIAFVSTGKDVTETEKYKKELETTISREMTKRMEQEKLIIQQSKMAAMGEMVGAIAHQWKQPLNALGIIVQDLEDAYRHNELDEKYMSEGVENSFEQIQYMAQTIDDFKNFFKPDRSEKIFHLESAINESLKLISKQFVANMIRCEITCEERVCAKGFESEFKQVVINIINNAKDAILEFRESGERVEGVINVMICQSGDKARLSIEDDAGGIKPEVREKIFEPYVTTKSETKGTGLGLYMARMIIEEHMQGSIDVEAGEKGARFVIELPAVPCDQ